MLCHLRIERDRCYHEKFILVNLLIDRVFIIFLKYMLRWVNFIKWSFYFVQVHMDFIKTFVLLEILIAVQFIEQ